MALPDRPAGNSRFPDYRELSERKRDILRAVIEAHIRDGEPVGSRALTDGHGSHGGGRFPFSSATIRNEMAELEQMGYLTHPHTSAGRIPSELGYRFYVDALMQRYEMTAQEIRQIEQTLRQKSAELDGILKMAGKVVSRLTNYPAIAVKPKSKKQTVLRFSVTPVDSESFLLVMVITKNIAKTRFIRCPVPLSNEVLRKLEEVLNRYLAGRDISALTLPEIMEMEALLGGYGGLISPIMRQIYDSLSGESEGGQLQLSGVENLLHYQEFTDHTRLKEVFGVFDNSETLLDLVSLADPGETRVYIGRENRLDAMRDSSLVFKTIVSGGKTVGAIGVIGPCRMNYAKVISTINYLSDDIAAMIDPDKSITQGEIKDEDE